MGAYSGGNLKDFWCYTPTTNSWERKANLPTACSNACFCFVLNNEIYIGAGFDGSAFRKEFWKYNSEQNTWTRLNNLLGAGRAGAIACAGTDHIYFGTGYDTTNKNDWWEYNPSSDSWDKRKNMPDDGRENGISLAIGNRYFVATGRHFGGDKTGGHVKSDIVEYDANKDVWYERGSMIVERENAICFIINGIAYIGLGENDKTILNDIWSFKP
jgi:N-acetylneuraminic acid mutarotase